MIYTVWLKRATSQNIVIGGAAGAAPPVLGWAAVTLAMITAYIRVLGGTLTGTQSFTGPMAKQHRMAVLTLGCLLSIAELWMRKDNAPASVVMWAALIVIVIGSAWTCVRRLGIITRELHALQSKAD